MNVYIAIGAFLLASLTARAGSYSPSEAFLGIYLKKISREKARRLGFDNYYGVYVSEVIPGTAAERAGVQPLDYIYGIDQYRTGAEQSLGSILSRYQPEQKAILHLYRKGKPMQLPIILGERGQREATRHRSRCEEPFLGISPRSGMDSPRNGIAVDIVGNSTAESMGMKDGDLIQKINGHLMVDWEDVKIVIDNMQVGDPIRVHFTRGGERLARTAAIRSHCDTRMEQRSTVRPEPGEWFDRYFKEEEEEEKRIKAAAVVVRDLSGADVARVNQRSQLSLPDLNNLPLEDFSVETDFEQGSLRLSFILTAREETTVQVYKRNGRLIYSYELGPFSGPFEDDTNVLQNGPGDYYLEVKQGKRSLVKWIHLSGN